MTKRLKRLLALFFGLLFLIPSFVKLFDASFHHHDHFSCTAKHEHHFHVYHKKCAISTFALSHFTAEAGKGIAKTNYSSGELVVNYPDLPEKDRTEYSFLLRAPPV